MALLGLGLLQDETFYFPYSFLSSQQGGVLCFAKGSGLEGVFVGCNVIDVTLCCRKVFYIVHFNLLNLIASIGISN